MSTEQSQPEKKITAWDLKMLGSIYGDDACGNCTDAHTKFKEYKTKAKIPIHYSVTDIDSSEAKKLVEEKGITAKPYIKACPVYEDGTTDESQCKEATSWNESDWRFLIEESTQEDNKKEKKS
jgi:hypothetical protein